MVLIFSNNIGLQKYEPCSHKPVTLKTSTYKRVWTGQNGLIYLNTKRTMFGEKWSDSHVLYGQQVTADGKTELRVKKLGCSESLAVLLA